MPPTTHQHERPAPGQRRRGASAPRRRLVAGLAWALGAAGTLAGAQAQSPPTGWAISRAQQLAAQAQRAQSLPALRNAVTAADPIDIPAWRPGLGTGAAALWRADQALRRVRGLEASVRVETTGWIAAVVPGSSGALAAEGLHADAEGAWRVSVRGQTLGPQAERYELVLSPESAVSLRHDRRELIEGPTASYAGLIPRGAWAGLSWLLEWDAQVAGPVLARGTALAMLEGVAEIDGEPCDLVRVTDPARWAALADTTWAISRRDGLPRSMRTRVRCQAGPGELAVTLRDVRLSPELSGSQFRWSLPGNYDVRVHEAPPAARWQPPEIDMIALRQAAAEAARVGAVPPPVELGTRPSGLWRSSDPEARVRVIGFWAPWAPGSEGVHEPLRLAARASEGSVRAIAAIAWAEPGRPTHAAPQGLEAMTMGESALRAWGIGGVPAVVVLDGAGRVAWRAEGAAALDAGAVGAAVQEALRAPAPVRNEP